MCKPLSKEKSRIISQVALARDRYSALTGDFDTICCFFDFHETKESPMKMQKLLIHFLVFGKKA